MSTFNGARYLHKQLESIANQKDVSVTLIVNDDGSTDQTMDILNSWRSRNLIEEIHISNRIGSTGSFFKLLKMQKGTQPIAISDQDDVWYVDKLKVMLKQLPNDTPALCFSKRNLINDLGESIPQKSQNVFPSFANALVENVIPGNTMLLNSKLVRCINTLPTDNVVHYDAWIYLIASAYGDCFFVNRPLLNYRIHDGNQVGLRNRTPHSVFNSLRMFIEHSRLFLDSSQSNLDREKREILEGFLCLATEKKISKRIKGVFRTQVHRQRNLDDFVLKALLTLALFHRKG
jgi:rhamnosyltransferase